MPIAPFEPAELNIIERQDDAIVLVFRSAQGGEFPMKFQRTQVADFVEQLEQEAAFRTHTNEAPASDQEGKIVGWQVKKRVDGSRQLNLAVELPNQGRTVTFSCILIPDDARLLASDLS